MAQVTAAAQEHSGRASNVVWGPIIVKVEMLLQPNRRPPLVPLRHAILRGRRTKQMPAALCSGAKVSSP